MKSRQLVNRKSFEMKQKEYKILSSTSDRDRGACGLSLKCKRLSFDKIDI